MDALLSELALTMKTTALSRNSMIDDTAALLQQKHDVVVTELKSGNCLTQLSSHLEDTDDCRSQCEEMLGSSFCPARTSISEIMVFFLEKSSCADAMTAVLKDKLCRVGDNVETKVGLLYLMSDVLFNAQQQSIKSSFRYRQSIELALPEIFSTLGNASLSLGRVSRDRLSQAISVILSAWTSWSVYNPIFLDYLHDLYTLKVDEPIMSSNIEKQQLSCIGTGSESCLLSVDGDSLTDTDFGLQYSICSAKEIDGASLSSDEVDI